MAKKGGRPSTYRPKYAKQAYKLCLLGATDAELADFFGVNERTINRWKIAHEDFCQSLKAGKQEADATVAERLYRRALGYRHRAVKIVADAKTGTEHVVPYTEHYPPDTTAAIFWLKNRRPEQWRDRHDVSSVNVDLSHCTDEELERIAAGEDPIRVLADTRKSSA